METLPVLINLHKSTVSENLFKVCRTNKKISKLRQFGIIMFRLFIEDNRSETSCDEFE